MGAVWCRVVWCGVVWWCGRLGSIGWVGLGSGRVGSVVRSVGQSVGRSAWLGSALGVVEVRQSGSLHDGKGMNPTGFRQISLLHTSAERKRSNPRTLWRETVA